jgi:hypothetical protein
MGLPGAFTKTLQLENSGKGSATIEALPHPRLGVSPISEMAHIGNWSAFFS